MIKVLIADDHRLMRQGLHSLLEKDESIQVVGEAVNGLEAIELAFDLHPDVIVMDIDMPEIDGISATDTILSSMKEVRIIALSSHAEPKLASSALLAGARGYLLKNCAERDLVRAIYTVEGDLTFLSSEIAEKLITVTGSQQPDNRAMALDLLTRREREVLHQLVAGCTTKGIALTLGISQKTVHVHRQNIFNKIGVNSIAELIKFAFKHNLLEPIA